MASQQQIGQGPSTSRRPHISHSSRHEDLPGGEADGTFGCRAVRVSRRGVPGGSGIHPRGAEGDCKRHWNDEDDTTDQGERAYCVFFPNMFINICLFQDLLPRLTPILKNRHEKVQENCIDLVGRIADRGNVT